MSKLSELGSVSQKSRNTSKETPEVVSEQSTGDRDAIDTSSGGRPPVAATNEADSAVQLKGSEASVKEVGGPKGLEPTRYGDWESKGRCYDF